MKTLQVLRPRTATTYIKINSFEFHCIPKWEFYKSTSKDRATLHKFPAEEPAASRLPSSHLPVCSFVAVPHVLSFNAHGPFCHRRTRVAEILRLLSVVSVGSAPMQFRVLFIYLLSYFWSREGPRHLPFPAKSDVTSRNKDTRSTPKSCNLPSCTHFPSAQMSFSLLILKPVSCRRLMTSSKWRGKP